MQMSRGTRIKTRKKIKRGLALNIVEETARVSNVTACNKGGDQQQGQHGPGGFGTEKIIKMKSMEMAATCCLHYVLKQVK